MSDEKDFQNFELNEDEQKELDQLMEEGEIQEIDPIEELFAHDFSSDEEVDLDAAYDLIKDVKTQHEDLKAK